MNPDAWPAPAKLNLFLHITGRRSDGFHSLQTVFQFLQFADQLEFELTGDGSITLQCNYALADPDQDLVVRAARLLQQTAGIKQGAVITVMKQIPVGGGLGGGSSDAATTLVALNEFWDAGLSKVELSLIGQQLGADVPVFVQGRAAWAEGIGERLQPVQLVEDWFLIIYPGVQVSTLEVFNMPDLTRNSSPITIRDFQGGAGHNDCKRVVFRRYPTIAAAAQWLGQWCEARLTGTGSCLFGRFANEQAAREVLARVPAEWQAFVSRGCNISPLQQKLNSLT